MLAKSVDTDVVNFVIAYDHGRNNCFVVNFSSTVMVDRVWIGNGYLESKT